MRKVMGVIFILLIIAISYRLFFLVPWGFVAGAFDMADIALMLIVLGVAANFQRLAAVSIMKQPVAILIVLYFVMVSMHVSLASFNYHQSILNGIIAVRYQFFYLAFFLVVALLSDERKITKLLDWLSYFGLLAICAGLINHFGPKILFHFKAEDWGGIRAGFQRIFIPGMPLIALSVLWQLAKWVDKVPKFTGVKLLGLLGGIILHRGRGLTLGLMFVSLLMMIFKRKFRSMFGLFVAAVVVIVAAEFTMKENIFLYPIKGISEGIETDKGEGGRFDQFENDVREFKEHPWIGSGLIALRVSKVESSREKAELASDVRLVDLGYSHWVKHYGLLGIVWLLFFYWYLARLSLKCLRDAKRNMNPLDLFAPAYVFFVIITTVLHNHLMVETRIVLLATVAGILVLRQKAINEIPEVEEVGPENDDSNNLSKYESVKLR